jgi:putative ABC transport system substrate-binding protein
MARELVDLPVSILLTMGRATAPVARLGLPVPVVFVLSGDPILAGVTESLARPNSNLTGLTLLAAELHAKRVEILHDMLPDLHRIAVIGDPEHPGVELEHAHVREVARQLGIDVDFHPIRSRAELDMAFAALIEAPPQALCVFSDGSSLENKDRIAGFGLHRRLPVMTSWALFAQAGALCSYTRRAKC